MLIAVFFRFYQIREMPGGLFPDEAANGLDINLMQQGHLQPFYERGNGREALFFYMLWGSISVLGKGPWQHHIVSAVIGVLSVLACFLVTRRLFMMDANGSPSFSKEGVGGNSGSNRATNIALLAAFFMAVSSWHIVLSRTAFRAIQIPLFSSLTFYFLLCAYQSRLPSPIHPPRLAPSETGGEGQGERLNRRAYLYAFLAGVAFALGFYTYIAFRIMLPILVMLLFLPLLSHLKKFTFVQTFRQYWKTALFFLMGSVLVILPIGKYFYQHPGSFVGRASQVSIFNPQLYTINGQQLHDKPPLSTVLPVAVEVFKTQMLGFFTAGDLNWRSNISGYPFLSLLVSLFFGIGLILCSVFAMGYFFSPHKRTGWWKYFLLFGWFFGMMLPVVTTAEGIPHGLRGIGVIPAVFIISAWALYEFARMIIKLHKKLWQHVLYHGNDPQWVRQHHFIPLRLRLVNIGGKVLVIGFFFALLSQSYFLYFVYAANSPENFYYFRSDLTKVSQYLFERCDKAHTYLILDKFSVQTTDYLTSDWHGNFDSPCNVPYQQVDPESAWQLSSLTASDEVVFTQSTIFDIKKFKQYHLQFHLKEEAQNKFGQAVLAVYKISN